MSSFPGRPAALGALALLLAGCASDTPKPAAANPTAAPPADAAAGTPAPAPGAPAVGGASSGNRY